VTLAFKVGIPRYLPRSEVLGISNSSLIILARLSSVFLEKKIEDLLKLTFLPEALQNVLNSS